MYYILKLLCIIIIIKHIYNYQTCSFVIFPYPFYQLHLYMYKPMSPNVTLLFYFLNAHLCLFFVLQHLCLCVETRETGPHSVSYNARFLIHVLNPFILGRITLPFMPLPISSRFFTGEHISLLVFSPWLLWVLQPGPCRVSLSLAIFPLRLPQVPVCKVLSLFLHCQLFALLSHHPFPLQFYLDRKDGKQ